MAETFVIGNPLRASIGLLLLSGSLLALWTSRTIELGIAWTTVVPAVLLVIPAGALLPRRVFSWHTRKPDPTLELTDGWLWRRCLALPIANTEVEIVPTAGFCAVILHRHDGARTLATWIRPRTATRLLLWLDAGHPKGAFPRRIPVLPVGDR